MTILDEIFQYSFGIFITINWYEIQFIRIIDNNVYMFMNIQYMYMK